MSDDDEGKPPQPIPIQTRPCGLDCCAALETKVRKLRRSVEDWKEILLAVKSVLLWDQTWYPGAIVGASTIFFTLLWLLSPSVLSTVSLLGLTVTLSDYIVPSVARSVFKNQVWTEAEEKELEDLCAAVVIRKSRIGLALDSYFRLRTTKPLMYYGLTIAGLVLLAWLGNIFDNLFLTYLFVTILLLMPGMEQHGVLRRYGSMMSQKLSDFAVDAKSKMVHGKAE